MDENSYLHKYKTSYVLRMSADGKFLVRFDSSKIFLHDAVTFLEVINWKHLKNPSYVSFSNSGRYLVAINPQSKLALYRVDTLSHEMTINLNKGKQPRDGEVLFSPDDKLLVVVLYDHTGSSIISFDLSSKTIKEHLTLKNCIIKDMQYLNTRKTYIFSVFDQGVQSGLGQSYLIEWAYPFDKNALKKIESKSIKEWRFISYNEIHNCLAICDNENLIITKNDINNILFKAQYHSEKELAVNPIDIFKETLDEELINDELIKSSKTMEIKQAMEGYLTGVKWSQDGKYLVLIFSEVIKVFSFSKMNFVQEFRLHNSCYADFSPTGELLLIGTWKYGYIFETKLMSGVV